MKKSLLMLLKYGSKTDERQPFSSQILQIACLNLTV